MTGLVRASGLAAVLPVALHGGELGDIRPALARQLRDAGVEIRIKHKSSDAPRELPN
jgi:hypothetical protein